MAIDLTFRDVKGSPLTSPEADANIRNLYSVANNIPLSFAFTWLPPSTTPNGVSVANYLNNKPYSFPVSEIHTPVHFRITRGELTYIFQFRSGRGIWGEASGGNPDGEIFSSDLQLISILGTAISDVDPDYPGTVINDLGTIDDGNYISVLNADSWDLTDAGSVITVDGQNYEKNYYFSYTDDGVLYLIQFVGAPDEYGVGGTPFEAEDFVATTNSDVEPVAAPIQQAGQYYFLRKGWQGSTPNTGAQGEIGDLYEGTPNSNINVELAKYLGGEMTDLDNYKILKFTELNQE